MARGLVKRGSRSPLCGKWEYKHTEETTERDGYKRGVPHGTVGWLLSKGGDGDDGGDL